MNQPTSTSHARAARSARAAALALSIAWLAGAPRAWAQGAPEAAGADEVAALLAEADQIAAQVGQMRGLAPLGPIKKSVQGREALRAMLEARFKAEIKPEEVARETAVLVQMGMLEPGFDYVAFLLDLYSEQIAGFYDDKTRELVVIAGMDLKEQRIVMAHELFHAIQDQHFTIDSLRPPERGLVGGSGNEDRALARTALIEGDATAVMLDFTTADMGMLPKGSGASTMDNPMIGGLLEQLMGGGLDPAMVGQSPVLSSAPGWIQETLIFPYIRGLIFVAEMRHQRSWGRLDGVYLDPPESTEHILHPERYLSGDAPVLVALDPAALAGALGGGFAPIYENAQGELRLRLWLSHHLSAKALSKAAPGLTVERAAQGWGGDRLYGFAAGGEVALVGATVWDTELDAREFEAAMAAMVAARLPGAVLRKESGQWGSNHCFEAPGGDRVYVERWGSWVLFIDGLAPGASLQAVRDAAWASRRVGVYPKTTTRGRLDAEGP